MNSEHNTVVTMMDLVARLDQWRESGDTIVFTNGCFDIFHYGHAKMLRWSRQLGDRLVVGINTDFSVSRIKKKPMFDQDARAFVVSSLRAVDAVTLFDEVTPLELIKVVRPDVLVKGGDYAKNAIVGAKEVCSWGGRVELAPYLKGFSSSAIRSTPA